MEITAENFGIISADETTHKQAELRRMKLLATSLFWFFAIIFVMTSIIGKQNVWLGFIRATAEAAMVGAIADWFAVTALFRHPLNLKIPHTAIIPTRKDSIGETLGRFVKNNFLAADVISSRLRSKQITRNIAAWLIQPENSKLLANYVAVGVAAMVEVMKDEDVQGFIEHTVTTQIRSTQLAPLLGNLLTLLTSGDRQQELLSGIVKLGAHLLEENKESIKEKIGQETPWWLPKNVDNAIYQRIVDAFDKMLQDVSKDPNHPLHTKFNEVIERFVEDLKQSPEVIAKEESFKEEFLQHPIMREFSVSLWIDLKTFLIEYGSDPNADVRQPIQRGIIRFGETILNDEALLEKIDHWIEAGANFIVEEYGHEVEHLISYTIKRWDAEETSRKIELYVGKDLQFIRINGTIVGGLVGFVIHGISLLLSMPL